MMSGARRRLGLRPRGGRSTEEVSLPLRGWPPAQRPTPAIDRIDDTALGELNAMLPWQCFTVDGQGRRLGKPAWSGKRTEPQVIPDPRISRLHEVVDLTECSVLEVGCFEGVHTIALCDVARRVTAVDSRVENVVKTAVRCAFYGVHPQLAVVDVEREPADSAIWRVDVVHHVGVLYHLADPVSHLRAIAGGVRRALLLDTHVAADHEATDDWTVGGQTFRVRTYQEGGVREVFSGMYDSARWLLLDDLVTLVTEAGLTVHDLDLREERNGLRVCLLATRD